MRECRGTDERATISSWPVMTREKVCAFLLAVTLLCTGTVYAQEDGKEENGPVREFEHEPIALPGPRQESDISTEEALLKRWSVRSYGDSALTLAEISQLLWAAQGITSPRGFRTTPSAGALYPLEVYLTSGNVEGLRDGVYHYRPDDHAIAMTVSGDRRNELCSAALGQRSIRNAPAVIVFSAVYERVTGKYGQRGIQYVHMEIGHASQNVFLQAASLGLGTVVIGAFHDDAVRKALHMNEGERPLYIMPVGRIK